MNFSDALRRCVAFIQYKSRNPDVGTKIAGTAFFIAHHVDTGPSKVHRKYFHYVVTARHCIDGVLDRSANGMVELRVNTLDGGCKVIETDGCDWQYHPSDPAADVAVLPWRVDPDLDVMPLKTANDIADLQGSGLGLGDEICVTGLFVKRPGEKRNIPVVRTGNLAGFCEEAVRTGRGEMDAYLVELRSLGGLSGSPVFIGREGWVSPVLLGLMHGHWNMNADDLLQYDSDFVDGQQLNIGIGVVVPYKKIEDIINSRDLIESRERELAKMANDANQQHS